MPRKERPRALTLTQLPTPVAAPWKAATIEASDHWWPELTPDEAQAIATLIRSASRREAAFLTWEHDNDSHGLPNAWEAFELDVPGRTREEGFQPLYVKFVEGHDAITEGLRTLWPFAPSILPARSFAELNDLRVYEMAGVGSFDELKKRLAAKVRDRKDDPHAAEVARELLDSDLFTLDPHIYKKRGTLERVQRWVHKSGAVVDVSGWDDVPGQILIYSNVEDLRTTAIDAFAAHAIKLYVA